MAAGCSVHGGVEAPSVPLPPRPGRADNRTPAAGSARGQEELLLSQSDGIVCVLFVFVELQVKETLLIPTWRLRQAGAAINTPPPPPPPVCPCGSM